MQENASKVTISEMAKICRVSRQTLIYYDKHDIFKPAYTDSNGYRFYSIYQVPFLREICALKEKNFTLKDIVDNLRGRDISTAKELLFTYQKNLDDAILDLQKKRQSINDRIDYYRMAEKELAHINQPYIKHFPARKLLFSAWGTEDMTRKQMHLSHMTLRNQCCDIKVPVDYGWGAILRHDSYLDQHPLRGGGAYVNLPPDFTNVYGIPEADYIQVPAGYFVCMNIYAMPYEVSYMEDLHRWIEENHYTITGDYIDECILDTTFYTEDRKTDFCQIQIPIQIPGMDLELFEN